MHKQIFLLGYKNLSYTITCKTSHRKLLSFLHLLFLFHSFINKSISNKFAGDVSGAGSWNILGISSLSSIMSITHLRKTFLIPAQKGSTQETH